MIYYNIYSVLVIIIVYIADSLIVARIYFGDHSVDQKREPNEKNVGADHREKLKFFAAGGLN